MLRKNDLEISRWWDSSSSAQIRWCRGAIAEGAAPTLALALWKGTMLVGWHEPTEWMTLGKFTGSALGTKKIIYRTSFGPETSFQPLNFLGPAWSHAGPTWSLRCPDSLFLWEGARGNTPPMPIRPCWSDYEGIMVVRLPQKKKTHHQPQSKSNNFHPILSRVHISEASNLVGKPSNPPPPQLSASNSSPGQRKNSNFACKNGNLQSSFPENKNQPSKTSCQKKKLKIERIVYSTKTDVSPAHKYIPPKNNAAWIVKKMSLAKKGWSHLQKCVIPISLTNHPSSSDAPPPGLAFFSYGHLLIIFQMKPVITIGWGSTLNAKEKNCFGELYTPPKI